MFTLVPIKNRSRAPCSGTKSERSLSNNSYSIPARNADQCLKSVSPVDIQKSHWADKVHRIYFAFLYSTIHLLD